LQLAGYINYLLTYFGAKHRTKESLVILVRLVDKSLVWLSSSSSYGVLFQSVAVSTMWRQSARPEAFLHAEERPMFRGFRSASTERNQV